MTYAQNLRQARPDLRVKMASATSLKAQMKKADKSGAAFTMILAQDEIDNGKVSVKNMATGEQRQFDAHDWQFDADASPLNQHS